MRERERKKRRNKSTGEKGGRERDFNELASLRIDAFFELKKKYSNSFSQ